MLCVHIKNVKQKKDDEKWFTFAVHKFNFDTKIVACGTSFSDFNDIYSTFCVDFANKG